MAPKKGSNLLANSISKLMAHTFGRCWVFGYVLNNKFSIPPTKAHLPPQSRPSTFRCCTLDPHPTIGHRLAPWRSVPRGSWRERWTGKAMRNGSNNRSPEAQSCHHHMTTLMGHLKFPSIWEVFGPNFLFKTVHIFLYDPKSYKFWHFFIFLVWLYKKIFIFSFVSTGRSLFLDIDILTWENFWSEIGSIKLFGLKLTSRNIN